MAARPFQPGLVRCLGPGADHHFWADFPFHRVCPRCAKKLSLFSTAATARGGLAPPAEPRRRGWGARSGGD